MRTILDCLPVRVGNAAPWWASTRERERARKQFMAEGGVIQRRGAFKAHSQRRWEALISAEKYW